MLTAITLAVLFSSSSVTLTLEPPSLYLSDGIISEFQFEYFNYEGSGKYQIAGTIGTSEIAGTCSWSPKGIRCDLYFRGMYEGGSTFVPSLMIIDADLDFSGTAQLCIIRTGECAVTLQVRMK